VISNDDYHSIVQGKPQLDDSFVPAQAVVIGAVATSVTSNAEPSVRARSGPGLSDESGAGSRIWLYCADGDDAPVRHDETDLPEVGERELLWVDSDLESVEQLAPVWEKLKVTDLVSGLTGTGDEPGLVQHDDVIHIKVKALNDESAPVTLHCLVGGNWVVSLHDGNLDLVDQFNEPFHGETRIGELDGPSFLSMVLDWQISGYFDVIEDIQSDIDRLDEELLRRFPNGDGLLDRLQDLRRRVRELRKTLSPHRDLFELLSHPDSGSVLGSETAPSYRRLSHRLQQGMDAIDTTRDMIVGSFDIFMTRTAQATNDIMKRLTTISILLLPAVVIAGIMGMNFRVAIFDQPWMFWVILGLMAALAGVTLLVAKRKKWF